MLSCDVQIIFWCCLFHDFSNSVEFTFHMQLGLVLWNSRLIKQCAIGSGLSWFNLRHRISRTFLHIRSLLLFLFIHCMDTSRSVKFQSSIQSEWVPSVVSRPSALFLIFKLYPHIMTLKRPCELFRFHFIPRSLHSIRSRSHCTRNIEIVQPFKMNSPLTIALYH